MIDTTFHGWNSGDQTHDTSFEVTSCDQIGRDEPQRSRVLHARAIELECFGELDVAIECYRAALHEGGPDRQIAFDLAYALATAGRTDDAIAAYRSAIKLDPTFLDAWINLGDLLMSSGFVESAIDAFEEALAIDPDNPAARYNIADALDLLDHPDALTHWNRFVALHPPASAQLDFARQRIRDLSSLVSVRSV